LSNQFHWNDLVCNLDTKNFNADTLSGLYYNALHKCVIKSLYHADIGYDGKIWCFCCWSPFYFCLCLKLLMFVIFWTSQCIFCVESELFLAKTSDASIRAHTVQFMFSRLGLKTRRKKRFMNNILLFILLMAIVYNLNLRI
jgi:hypothetical protein